MQEALTNAVRHTPAGGDPGPGRRGSGTDVLLEVVNECDRPPDPVPGHGLVNMRERARLEGGVLEAGPVDGGFRVRAALPVAGGGGAVIRVLLADDDGLVRSGLRALLEAEGDITVVGEAADGREADRAGPHAAARRRPHRRPDAEAGRGRGHPRDRRPGRAARASSS